MCLTNDDIRRPTAALGYGRCGILVIYDEEDVK